MSRRLIGACGWMAVAGALCIELSLTDTLQWRDVRNWLISLTSFQAVSLVVFPSLCFVLVHLLKRRHRTRGRSTCCCPRIIGVVGKRTAADLAISTESLSVPDGHRRVVALAIPIGFLCYDHSDVLGPATTAYWPVSLRSAAGLPATRVAYGRSSAFRPSTSSNWSFFFDVAFVAHSIITYCFFDEVEIVEQPFAGGRARAVAR